MNWTNSYLLVFLLLSFKIYAVELYTFVKSDCQTSRGLIIDISEGADQRLTILQVDGQINYLKRSSIDAILIHTVVENPFEKIVVSKESQKNLYAIYPEAADESYFEAWPVQFIEELVVFLDIKGKIHVSELAKLVKIRSPKTNERVTQLEASKNAFLQGDLITTCEFPNQEQQNGLLPSRTLQDKIRISEFLNSHRHGLDRVESFRERTYFYAKPFLFDKRSKLGFFSLNPVEGDIPAMPIYFKWSSGRAYHFQSQNVLGGALIDWSSSLEPATVYYSEVKSHLFHGAFVGNILALSAGSQYYSTIHGFSQDKEKNKKIRSATSYNYIAFMGVDYKAFSFSAGTYYPIFLIQVKDQFREVLGSSVSPIFRFRYQTRNWSFSVTGSKTGRAASNGVTDREISIDIDNSTVGQLNSFNFDSSFLRFNFKMNVSQDLGMFFSTIQTTGDYSEVTSGSLRNKMAFSHLTLHTGIWHQFGDYVRLIGYANSYDFKRDYTFSNVTDNKGFKKTLFGGSLEFVF